MVNVAKRYVFEFADQRFLNILTHQSTAVNDFPRLVQLTQRSIIFVVRTFNSCGGTAETPEKPK